MKINLTEKVKKENIDKYFGGGVLDSRARFELIILTSQTAVH
jgi:hypothetical protein